MSLPVKKENKEQPSEMEVSAQILSNLTEEYFTGKNKEILNMFLSELSLDNVNQLFETVISSFEKHIDLQSLNNNDIEQLDIVGIANAIAKDLACSLKYEKTIEISENDKKKFDDVLKELARVTLHDVAFPMMVMENPNVAVSAKNLLKRFVSSLVGDEKVDLSEVYEELDIENLPVEPSMDLFLRLGGNIRGLPEGIKTIQDESVNDDSTVLYCELSTEQAVYLAKMLQEDYFSIKNWKALYNLLKSNGKHYGNVIVCDNKKGLLLSVLDVLHEKRTIAGERYFRMNKGNGIWPFLQGYLINSKTDKPFERELRKLRSENDCEVDAKKIIGDILDPTKQNEIIKRATEIINKDKI